MQSATRPQRAGRAGRASRAWIVGLLLALVLAPVAPAAEAAAQASNSSVTVTRDLLNTWVQTRMTIADTESKWLAEQEIIQRTLALFAVELESLDELTHRVNTNQTQALKEIAVLQAEKATLDEALVLAAASATEMEASLRRLSKTWPRPLLDKVSNLLLSFPENPAETKATVNERMRNVVGVINEVDKFNAAISLETEVQQSPQGTDVQVRTLYLGLGQAYFVDESGAYAGVGLPGPEGWQWQTKPELASTLKQVIGIYENTRNAVFVGLPVEIK
jgi:hypothetical protein